ncbi:MAG: YciI family protein [Sterolibacterium sp.]|nr:YciI family protein [Sterolibacterium sp.]
MLYALYGEDAAQSLEKRLSVRAEHLARLQALYDQGRLILAGPLPAIDSPDPGPAGFAGSLIVAEFASQTDAETWLAADPYVAAGVFKHHWVRPFKQVFPK